MSFNPGQLSGHPVPADCAVLGIRHPAGQRGVCVWQEIHPRRVFKVRLFYSGKGRSFFNFTGFHEGASRDTDPNLLLRFLKNVWRNIRATGPMFLLGILLTALYQIHVPQDFVGNVFGKDNGFAVLMAATIGVPVYMCGGGTIPLLQQWLLDGMSMGSAAAFMITGPATKITNLGAMKIVLGWKRFALYILFAMAFAWGTGIVVNMIL